MKRRGFLSLLAAVPLAPLIKLDESSRYRALARKMSRCWAYGKAEWRFSPKAVRVILQLKDELSSKIQIANKNLAMFDRQIQNNQKQLEKIKLDVRLDGKLIQRKTISA